MTHPEFNLSIF